MKKFISLFLSLIFFFGTVQNIFANQCSEENIKEYFMSFEKFSDEVKKEKFGEKILKNIFDQKDFYVNKNIGEENQLKRIEKMNSEFIKKEDDKFSLAIQYAIIKFSEDDGNPNLKGIKTENILTKLEKNDIFIEKYLDDNKENKDFRKNLKNIPVSVLQKSVYLDFYIFSCGLGSLGIGTNFFAGGNISNVLSKSNSNEFKKEEILTKQQIVVNRAIKKYQSFLTHREMYVTLRGVIKKMEHLKWRFEDFARLIGFLPAKLVDFGYKK